MSVAPTHVARGGDTDIRRVETGPTGWASPTETSGLSLPRLPAREVRVVLAKLGDQIRLSAADIHLVVEADTTEAAWLRFVEQAKLRVGKEAVMYDVAPTRAEEMLNGLDAPEDEDLPEPVHED